MLHRFAFICAIVAGCAVAPACAKIVGIDDRAPTFAGRCGELGFTLARLVVPTENGRFNLSTATLVSLDGGAPFFLTTAHSIYRGGRLRAPLDRISVEVLLPTPQGECRFRAAKIARFAASSSKPQETY